MSISFILDSASPRRKELLQQMGFSFQIQQSDVNEDLPAHILPDEAVKTLALRKAVAVAEQQSKPALVLGADTLVYHHQILGKPIDEPDATRMLKQLQGDKHQVYSSIALVESIPGQACRTWVDMRKTNVWMRTLTEAQIQWYIHTQEPMDKAGAYGIQGKGACLIEKIEGCYFNVVGMSLILLDQMLSEAGYSLQTDFMEK